MNRSAQPQRTRDQVGLVKTVVSVTALVLFFVVMLAVIAALTFSVKVYGHSMQPTLHDGDRLVTNIFGRGDVHRFDLVQASAGKNGIEVVKRVIGMPGDQVRIVPGSQLRDPAVLVRPAGEGRTYVVDNPAWTGQYGGKLSGCCDKQGHSVPGLGHWLTLADQTYWLLGDNWGGSDDSRTWGTVTSDEISSTLNFRLLPLDSFGRISDEVSLRPMVHADSGQR